jgi:glyoxylase-like metal-dependent hydrolase (beta-lactamase superfamily II)
MAKNNHHFDIKRFITPQDRNQYLLISRDEAAVIDVSESHAEIGQIIDNLGAKLKYLLITHAHKSHLLALPDMKKNMAGPSVFMSMSTNFSRKWKAAWSPIELLMIKNHYNLETSKLRCC